MNNEGQRYLANYLITCETLFKTLEEKNYEEFL